MLPGAAKAHEAAALNAAAPVVLAPRRRKKVDYTGQQVRCAALCAVLCVTKADCPCSMCAVCCAVLCVNKGCHPHRAAGAACQ